MLAVGRLLGAPSAPISRRPTIPITTRSAVKDHNPNVDRRQPGTDAAKILNEEETLVADSRASLTPSQMVEQKLIGMLNGSPLLVSHVQQRLKPGPR
jgi:hypothetical protein